MENYNIKPKDYQFKLSEHNDRYIPNRALSNMDLSYHLFHETNQSSIKLYKNTRVLHLHMRPIELNQQFGNYTYLLAKKSVNRRVPTTPERILDAPELKDDYYLNLIDWSISNLVSVPLNRELYLWNENERNTTSLFELSEYDIDGYFSSTAWMSIKSNILAVGLSNSEINTWDVNKRVCVRVIRTQASRIGVMCWNDHILSSGSLLGIIHHYDERASNYHVNCLRAHDQEICGLKWSPDGRYLASGGNDNKVVIWDANMLHQSKPLHVFTDHTAAVKAISWCPWKSNILATGGGRADGNIKIWNIYNGNCAVSRQTEAQISSLIWSKEFKEIISSHGNPFNQLTIWKCPDLVKICDLKGHKDRILSMVLSPDQETILSAGADETLRLWKCFALNEKQKKQKIINNLENINSSLSSSKYIR